MSPQVGFVYLPCYDGGRTALRGRVSTACAAFAGRTGHLPTVVLVPPGTPTAGLPGLPVTLLAEASVRPGELWPGAPDPPVSRAPGAPDSPCAHPTPDGCPAVADPAACGATGRPPHVNTAHRRHRRTAA